MEVYPEKMDHAHHIMSYTDDVVYRPFFGGKPPSAKNEYSHSLIPYF